LLKTREIQVTVVKLHSEIPSYIPVYIITPVSHLWRDLLLPPCWADQVGILASHMLFG